MNKTGEGTGCRSTSNHVGTHSCNGAKKNSKMDLFLNIIEKTSAIALGIFSAYISWQLFVPFFFAGVCIGIYGNRQNENSCHNSASASSCAQGLLEQLTGVKLPRIVSIATNLAITICHIEHHSVVFVPVIAISLGAWAGNMQAHYGLPAWKKISSFIPKGLRA